MENPEKNTESLLQTSKRTIITTTIIALILTWVIPHIEMSRLADFGIIWIGVFCIVFGGHWLELGFINHIKFIMPQNILLLYSVRISYWFLSALPLFALANLTINMITNKTVYMGRWWIFGFLYIGIQLIMHAIMQLKMKKSFYNGVY